MLTAKQTRNIPKEILFQKPVERIIKTARNAKRLHLRSIRLAVLFIMIHAASAKFVGVAARFQSVCSTSFATFRPRRNYALFGRRCQPWVMIKESTNQHERLFSSLDEHDIGLDTPGIFTLRLAVPTPEDMEDVGAILSMGTTGGDVILLGGDLGAGKTCFSRGFVRTRTGLSDMRVTSPTYLLSNTYDADDVTIHHMDLYRLSGKDDDLAPLNFDYVLKNCISLIEWPSRLGDAIPKNRLEITFKIDPEYQVYYDDDEQENNEGKDDDESLTRILTLVAHGDEWRRRLQLLEDDGYIDDLIIDDDYNSSDED